MMDPVAYLEGQRILGTAFSDETFAAWWSGIRQQRDLMTLVERCLDHAAARVEARHCGCVFDATLGDYPAACRLVLARSHLLLAELDVSGTLLDRHAGEYNDTVCMDIEASFTDWLRERAGAGLITVTGWCGALHHAVLILLYDHFAAALVETKELAILQRINRLIADPIASGSFVLAR